MVRFGKQLKKMGIPSTEIDYTGEQITKNMHRMHNWNDEMVRRFPRNTPFIRLPNPAPELIANTPEAVEFMLKSSFETCTKPGSEDELFELLREFIGEGIFTLRHGKTYPRENALWKAHRTGSLIFSNRLLEGHAHEVFVEKGNLFRECLREIADKNINVKHNDKTKGAAVIDFQAKVFSFTMSSIEELFFGESVDAISKDEIDPMAYNFDKAHRAMMKFLFKNIPKFVLISKLPFPFGNLIERELSTGLLYPLLKRLSPEYQEFAESVRIVKEMTRKKAEKIRADPNIAKRKDLISNMINLGPKLGKSWTDDEIQAACLNMMLAGRDTTACTLTFLFYNLAMRPEVQRKLQEEIDRVLQGRVPTFEDCQKNLPYLHGVVHETLRLHPPVPADVKVVTEDTRFNSEIVIPKGTRLTFLPFSFGRNETIYANPEEFKPERWSISEEPDLFKFPVFQAGNRTCVGIHFARFEVKMLTAMLLQQFSFDIEAHESPENITYSMMVTMSLCNNLEQTSHNLWLVPRHRDHFANA